MVRLALYDYGAGNIFSLKNAFERMGAQVHIITELRDDSFAGLLLPGVGNFDPAIRTIPDGGIDDMVGESIPVLGICLGMEMFLDSSQEGSLPGLGIISGRVISLPKGFTTPHMGWNSLDIQRAGVLLEDIPQQSWVYFVHSYMAKPQDHTVVTAVSDYGVRVPAVMEYKNFIGTQFHPEKSGAVGRVMLHNFLEMCRR